MLGLPKILTAVNAFSQVRQPNSKVNFELKILQKDFFSNFDIIKNKLLE
jgi:hypothetical protein